MPMISCKVSKKLTACELEEIKNNVTNAIEIIPNKKSSVVMVMVEDDVNLYIGGSNDESVGFFDVGFVGSASKETCMKLSNRLKEILSDVLNVSPKRIYVRFSFNDGSGYNGYMF